MIALYEQLISRLKAGANIQTGSLLFTKGSAPQFPGAMAIFEKEKVLGGTLGGGLLEAEAQKVAALSAVTRKSVLQWVHFQSELEDPTGAICGGSALFLIDANPTQHRDVYLQMLDSIRLRKSGALITLIQSSGNQVHSLQRRWIEQQGALPETTTSILLSENLDVKQIIDSRTPCYIETDGDNGEKTILFIEPIHPIPQLIIAGAGHIGQALSRISSLVDFEITVVDDRPDLAVSSRFPDAARVICQPLYQVFNTFSLTTDVYVVIATQGHRTDIEALKSCICSNAAYIGVIGSKRKTALMGQKFIAEKWATPEEWKFVHTPVGIDIHSRTVNEIAVSILSELIKERHEIYFSRSKKQVTAIVLAAGKSTRMGQQKLLMPFEGKSMIATVAGKIAGTGSSRTIVVTGSDRNKIEKELEAFPVLFVDNERYEEGMLTSVQAGVAAAGTETDGYLILLGDQPMVSKAVINRLIIVFQKGGKGLLIPVFKGKRGHPVLIGSKYTDEIKTLNPEIGLRELFLNHPDDILEIEVESEDVLKDIDTPDDYELETKQIF
ncbi:MAG: NTP transferase domain-containing protein [Prolixibacteraceae bacterium]|jgi:xanthine dehydrogenase accessory factor|nr:NTP transferase domain-containing protein [Prolixibacteraceae bacterium]